MYEVQPNAQYIKKNKIYVLLMLSDHYETRNTSDFASNHDQIWLFRCLG